MKFETLALHAGQNIDQETRSRAVPIYRTAAYTFKNTEHAANLFALKELGNIYTRIGNPTQDVLEQRMAKLEGGAAALALASGTSAIFYTMINICAQGDEIVAANNLYGGTYTQFDTILPQLGIKVHFVDPANPENFKAAITEKTRALYCETLGNPSLGMTDLDALAAIAKEHHLPLVVDSTFTPPCLLRPIDHGADIVIHSLTKWIGGHGTAIGGIAIDAGTFNWQDPKFSLYNEPDPSYHGLRYAHDLGDLNPVAFALRMRLVPLRNLGASISPDNCWSFLQGIETLSLRMSKHNENAMHIAQYLDSHEGVNWVYYPGLSNSPGHKTAAKYLKNGFGGMITFGIKGGLQAGKAFIDSLQLVSHLANVGDTKSLAIHPASTTHSQLSPQQLKAADIDEGMVRLSVGIEHIDDIIEDLSQALEKAV
ncbi:O-acetylhomoserine aminocarboxypropyltransferase/cysteine synthase family protein [Desulforhopalus sp. IMCC35007]|uniref:O-acetylhomoserine aminocarboxypropyltransferase/cysteine synthase family protein n=1 Tax=Desulforhopalus sp. IMCC35007 TaxID=2569543 RepID=UPI0010ADCD1A|nr:O-acetylhomoserine aminocarboxypropyltransferase/cysteine synthase family protein [Desulforhopalus sp. IMCC35007]TKB10853.1 O-acetylhomoserine aminocarboxypropyltransferase/cysteine synthase [Desulforhopalus sp. IMCC35007]